MNQGHAKPAGEAAAAASHLKKEQQYWLKKLSGEPVKAIFPYDHPVPSPVSDQEADAQSRRAEFPFSFPPGICAGLERLRNGSDNRLHMILTAGLVLLLHKYSFQSNPDITVGSPVLKQSDRREFINTVLVLRTLLTPGMNFKGLLLSIRTTIAEATAHQNYPLEVLLEQLGLKKADEELFGDFPLLDVALMLENIHRREDIVKINPSVLLVFSREGGNVSGKVDYVSARYSPEAIQGIVSRLTLLLENTLSALDQPLSEISILSETEKRQIVEEFNKDAFSVSETSAEDSLLHLLFSEQARRTPDSASLIDSSGQSLTYASLDARSNRLAALLVQTYGIRPGRFIGLITDQSFRMVTAILAILKAGAAYVPLDPTLPRERIKHIIRDAVIPLCLTDGNYPDLAEELQTDCEPLQAVVTIDAPGSAQETETPAEPAVEVTPGHVAYIIYTSGSTGVPKGVLVEHRTVTAMLRVRRDIYRQDTASTALQLFSYAFDGFVTSLFTPLISGAAIVILNRDEIKDTGNIPKRIKENRVTHFISVPSLFRTILDHAFHGELDSLRTVTLAGESLPPELLEILQTRIPHLEIANEYGVTETSVMSTLFRNQQSAPFIAIGRPIPGTFITICNSSGQLQSVGIPGEIRIAGTGVARGYLNNPALTAEKFGKAHSSWLIAHRKNSGPGAREAAPKAPPMSYELSAMSYLSGDLARWREDGNIQFLGRIDRQVKIRGFRIEIGEIENQLIRCHNVGEAVVVVRESPVTGEDELCAYLVWSDPEHAGGTDAAEGKSDPVSTVIDQLENRLPAYMIPAFVLPLKDMPRTPNGKIDRKALPEPRDVVASGLHVAPETETQQKLANIWSEILTIDEPGIGIDDNFFRLGGHSLKATTLISKMQKEFDVKIPLTELFRIPTIRGISHLMETSEKTFYKAISPVEEKEYYPVSSAQGRLYFLNRMAPDSTGYNMPQALLLEGDIQRDRLEDIFRQLIRRNESLRTSFIMLEGKPVQRVHREADFTLHYDDGGDPEPGINSKNFYSRKIKEYIYPFDLSIAPLMRVALIKAEEDRFLLVIDLNHIICDGVSIDVMREDFVSLYEGKTLEPPVLPLQFKDFSQWHINRRDGGSNGDPDDSQVTYWTRRFSDHIPVLDLAYDYLRPPVQSFEGSRIGFNLDETLTSRLKELEAREDVTFYMVQLTLYFVLLHRLSGQEDIVIGTPVAGRRHDDLERIIGMFVNTLAIRCQPLVDMTFSQFMQHVKENSLGAFENQEYPFEDLVQQVAVNRDTQRNPLFDVVFSLQPPIDISDQGSDGEGVSLRPNPYSFDTTVSKFDLTLDVVEPVGDEPLYLSFEYCTRLFNRETIMRYIAYYRRIVRAVAENSHVKLSEIDILSEEEKQRILNEFNGPRTPYDSERTLRQLFADWVEKVPDRPALRDAGWDIEPADGSGEELVTYRELDRRASGLARVLRSRGIGPDVITAVMVNRSPRMIVAVLGILKAGGAYLPLDAGYPPERIRYMLADSGVCVLVAGEMEIETLNNTGINHLPEIVSVDAIESDAESIDTEPLHSSPSDLAYVIYTSGSTGRPKGTAVQHRGFINMIQSEINSYHFTIVDDADDGLPLHHMVQFASLAFDASAFEIFSALLSGSTLVLFRDSQIADINELIRRLNRLDRFSAVFPPSYLKRLRQAGSLEYQRIHVLLSAGESPIPEDVAFFSKKVKYFNVYGPTEASVCVARFLFPEGYDGRITIGKAIDNVSISILSGSRLLQPIGVSGELCVSGDCLARGYLNNPQLTSEKFHKAHTYFTGDLARWMPDGNIEFLGRIDHQVKIRGYRVELGEIESRLVMHESVSRVVVLAGKDADGRDSGDLSAYIVWNRNAAVPVALLREYLLLSLPGYMVPARFIQVDSIPLTTNKKIDRRALRERGRQLSHSMDITLTPPKNDIERSISETWKNVLGLDQIGVNDNFFEVGGNSIKLIELSQQLEKRLGREIPIPKVYLYPTIALLAKFVQDETESVPPTGVSTTSTVPDKPSV